MWTLFQCWWKSIQKITLFPKRLDQQRKKKQWKKGMLPSCPSILPTCLPVALLSFNRKLPICPLVACLPHLPACWRKSRPVSSLLLTAHPPTLPSPSPPKSTYPCIKVTKRPSVKVIKWPSASNCTTSDHALNCWNTQEGWSVAEHLTWDGGWL